MRRRRTAAAVALALLALTGCVSGGSSKTDRSAAPPLPTAVPTDTACQQLRPTVRPKPDAQSLRRAGQVLGVVAAKGWNPQAPSRVSDAVSGGLYVNWRADWDGRDAAANTNVATSGLSDDQSGQSPRHDPLTDLVVLRDLDAYLATGVRDAAADDLRCKLQPVVAQEFNNYSVFRAWVYTDLVELAELDPDGKWLPRAQRMATSLATTYVNPTSFVAADPRRGTYRPDYAAQTAAALVDAGTRFGRPEWIALGEGVALRLVRAAPDPVTGLFPGEMRPGSGRDEVVERQMKTGSQAQLLDALLKVWDHSHDDALVAAVRRAVGSLQAPSIGIVDPVAGGYFFGANADGTAVRRDYKETRFSWMLPLLEHLGRSTGVAQDTAALRDLIRDRLWQTAGAAYVYRVAPDFTAYIGGSKTPVQETWVSTEAVGIAIQTLLGELT